MNPDMKKQLDTLMETWSLNTGSAGHPADRSKLRDFFIRWYEQGVTLSVAEWEAYLLDRGWDRNKIREVDELPGDVAIVARHFGG